MYYAKKSLGQNFLKDKNIIKKIVNLVKVENKNKINLITFERGCGFTQACGTAACASVVVCNKMNLCEKRTDVLMRGGKLTIDYLSDGHVLMTGPVSKIFEGNYSESDLE